MCTCGCHQESALRAACAFVDVSAKVNVNVWMSMCEGERVNAGMCECELCLCCAVLSAGDRREWGMNTVCMCADMCLMC